MNKIIIAIIVLSSVVVAGLLYFNVNDSGNGAGNIESSLPTPTPTNGLAPSTHAVAIQGFVFNQPSITIKKGDTVVWTNKDSAPHTVTGNPPAGGGSPSSPTMNLGITYSFTFTTAGTFNYHCALHPSMTGKVIVTP